MKFLAIDMINKANSGHPGIVLDAAPIMYSLFQYHLDGDPKNPDWFNRDRFILSAGHGSALLYSTLFLAGYDIPFGEIQKFRQLGSMTPGHPEYRHTPGVEATTGPLGQGIGMAVGMALAEAYLGATFNRPGFPVVNHDTYTLCGDGDLQEGVAMEALSLAGHLRLNKLTVLFDSNDIQLDGPTSKATSDDIKAKMESMGFFYQKVESSDDVIGLSIAIEKGRQSDKPSFIEIKGIIGEGSAKQGTSAVHGSPIGVEDALRMKLEAGYSLEDFCVLDTSTADFSDKFIKRGQTEKKVWDAMITEYAGKYPEEYKQLTSIMNGECDLEFVKNIGLLENGQKEATRKSIGRLLKTYQENNQALIGGSADLTPSTQVKGINGDFSIENRTGRNINFGVREHAMGAIVNGLTLHGLRGFSGGFFVFSDYMKPAIRLGAIMGIPSLFIFTHDSIAVGEDGPTHEPVEQLAAFRSTPNLLVLRPADANETAYAMHLAMETMDRPTVIILTRQDLTVAIQSDYLDFKKGAYIASDIKDYTGIIIASGSELGLAMEAQEKLYKEHQIPVRVVSMPSMETFLGQSEAYQNQILSLPIDKRLAIEMGASGLWYRFAGNVVGIDTFGASGKAADVLKHFGFTADDIVSKCLKAFGKNK
mgnify:CR=1 FL=1